MRTPPCVVECVGPRGGCRRAWGAAAAAAAVPYVAGIVGGHLNVVIDPHCLLQVDAHHCVDATRQARPPCLDERPRQHRDAHADAFAPRFMQVLIICDVKKSVSPLRSVAILRKSSSKIGQIALVGCCLRRGTDDVAAGAAPMARSGVCCSASDRLAHATHGHDHGPVVTGCRGAGGRRGGAAAAEGGGTH